MIGKLYGIGVGPGDPELLTLKAKRLLEQVDVLLIPRSNLAKRSLALEIVERVVVLRAEPIDLLLPMTSDRVELERHWQLAAETIIEILKTGKDAAFITLGDPSLYSTFIYIHRIVVEQLAGLSLEIVPGVSSIHAIAAEMQVPLAEADESLAIVPGLKEAADLQKILADYDNIVLMKAGGQIEKISQLLSELAAETRVYYASRCGFADGYFTNDLSKLKQRKLDYLSTLIIKKESSNRAHKEARP